VDVYDMSRVDNDNDNDDYEQYQVSLTMEC
jgi:hypothetical protein